MHTLVSFWIIIINEADNKCHYPFHKQTNYNIVPTLPTTKFSIPKSRHSNGHLPQFLGFLGCGERRAGVHPVGNAQKIGHIERWWFRVDNGTIQDTRLQPRSLDGGMDSILQKQFPPQLFVGLIDFQKGFSAR
jgi:hypothetical protein